MFNGEIYNFRELRAALVKSGHRFCSQSDTEVVLAAYEEWGAECLSHLNGMFAFALIDLRQRKLFIARDRAGEKPLFYALANGELRFASELKGLMADERFPRRIDRAALDCYLAMGYVPGDRCILDGVRKLPPAHALAFNLDSERTQLWRYWSLPTVEGADTHDSFEEETLIDELEWLLEDAVRRQMAADVPVGVLLSGGVDSSLVTAMAARMRPGVKTFTVGFSGYGQYDEKEHARLIARHFRTDHTELEAGASDIDLVPMLAKQFDEPMVDSSMVPTFLVSRLIREHCTVAIGGDGGDELFGGYPQYSRMLWTSEHFSAIPESIRVAAAWVAGEILPVGTKGRVWIQSLATDYKINLPMVASLFDRPTRRKLMAGCGTWNTVAEDIREGRVPNAPDLLQRATRMDFENYLAEDILVKVDRASMLNALEVRAPLLDHRVIEFAYGKVPSALKATSGQRKILLKKLASRILPPEFDQHRKQGFSIPLAAWLRSGPWRELFHDVLLSSESRIFDRRVVGRIFAGQSMGRSNSERLFGLVLFELWRRVYRVSI